MYVSNEYDYKMWLYDLQHQMPLGIALEHLAIRGPDQKNKWKKKNKFTKWLSRFFVNIAFWILWKDGFTFIYHE